MRKFLVAFLVLAMLVLAGCATQGTDQGVVIPSKFDNNLYTVVMRADDLTSHQDFYLSGSAMSYSSGFGYGSVSAWTDGKGILRGELISIDPYLDGYTIGDIAILKTTDLKVKMVKVNDIITLICTADYEPVVSLEAGTIKNVAVNVYELWELDYCRLVHVAVGE